MLVMRVVTIYIDYNVAQQRYVAVLCICVSPRAAFSYSFAQQLTYVPGTTKDATE